MPSQAQIRAATKTFEAYPGPCATEDAIKAALEAAEGVRWMDIETAPKDGTIILAAVPWLPYAKPLFWAAYADEWRCPALEDAGPRPYGPTHFQPLPSPPESKSK